MKMSTITSMLISIAIFQLTACESEQPVDQLLKDDAQRSEIISAFIDHQPYRTEMMNAIVENDSCRLWMGQKMMDTPEMMGMMMSDPAEMKGSMNHLVDMAAQDTVMFNDMIRMMKDKPEMWSTVMKMNSSTTKTN